MENTSTNLSVIFLQSTIKGYIGRIIVSAFWLIVSIVIVSIILTHTEWFVGDEFSTFGYAGPSVKWLAILGCIFVGLVNIIGLFRILLYANTYTLHISKPTEDNPSYKAIEEHKSWFLYKHNSTSIAHQFSYVKVIQGFWGSIFNTGSLELHMERYRNMESEDVKLFIYGVENPLKVKEMIENQLPMGDDKISIGK